MNYPFLKLDVWLDTPQAPTYAAGVILDANGTEDWNACPGTFSQAACEFVLDLAGSIIDEIRLYDDGFTMNWRYKVSDANAGWIPLGSTHHTAYVIYGDPSYSALERTEKRLETLCAWANGAGTRKAVADAIHAALSLPFGPQDDDDWDLMWPGSGARGECDEQARFMKRCLDILGVSDSEPFFVYASVDSDVEDKEPNAIGGDVYYLKFDANGDGIVDNNFEGALDVPTDDSLDTWHSYTVTPKLDGTTPCRVWRKLGPDSRDWKQRWIYAPYGNWNLAWPPQPTLPHEQDYVACPE